MPEVREAVGLGSVWGVVTGEHPLASRQRGDAALPRSKMGVRGTLKHQMPPARKEEGWERKRWIRGETLWSRSAGKGLLGRAGGELAGALQPRSLTVINVELRL